MKQYSPSKIRNIVLAGHGASGKTSLAEALLFKTNATDRLGKVSDGNTVCDFDPEEIKRKISVSSAVAPFEYNQNKVNIIDTPGLFDFAAGFHEGIRAAESVVIVVSGKSGVTVGVEKSYKAAITQNKSRMFFVTKLDTENADFYKVLEDLKSTFGPSVCPLVVPFVEDRKIECYINLIDMKAYSYTDGKSTEVPMPDVGHRLEGLVAAISEAVAETDESLFEKYFSGEQFTRDEMINGIHNGIKQGVITPVFCGSSYTLEGIDMLLDGITELLPTAAESGSEKAENANGELIDIACDENAPCAAFVFKTVADPFVGKLSYFKVVSGQLSTDINIINQRTGQPERIGKLLVLKGKKQEETDYIGAGDIGAATKLSEAITGDSLCDAKRVVKFEPAKFPNACMAMALKPKSKGDEGKISQGLQRLMEEDATISFYNNAETRQQLVSGLGEQHLDVVISKLKAKFGVEVDLYQPRVAYRETIRKKVKVEGKHKKQTGGHGQFGHVWIEFEPCDSEDLVFEEKVFGGAVPRNFFPAVEKGLRESMLKGVLAGYPVVGLKATLVDGSYHPVDSSEMSFKMAASLAYRAGLAQASPAILEPIGLLKVLVPDNNTGDIIGELNKRRGRVLGMNPDEDKMSLVEAEVPMSEMYDFTTALRSMTQGRGSYSLDFERYEPLPSMLESKVIEDAKALREEE